MNYLRGAINAASQYYRDINPSTLTGAIDVIVVRRTVDPSSSTGSNPSGTSTFSNDAAKGTSSNWDSSSPLTEDELACSPFHVRFGKWQVLRPVDKKVKVLVNGKEIPFSMKIGDAGEAFFVFETDDEVPEDLITSPILEATRSRDQSADRNGDVNVEAGRFGTREDGEMNMQRRPESRQSNKERLDEPEPLDLNSSSETGKTPRSVSTSRESASASPPDVPILVSEDHEKGYSDSEKRSARSSLSPTRLLGKSASVGKAIVNAVVETDREMRQQLSDKEEAMKNAATHVFSGPKDHQGDDNGPESRGDEALPPVREGEGDPPPVVYSRDMVLDTAGYHSKDPALNEQMQETSSKISGRYLPRLWNEETDTSDSYDGPSTPMSENPSADANATPTQSPDTSRSPSPGIGLDSFSKRYGQPIPTIRASSEPPEQGSSPPSAYTWEWGAFPEPSPLKANFVSPPLLDLTDPYRSVSVPPVLSTEGEHPRPSTPTRAKTVGNRPDDVTQGKGTRVIANDADLSADENNGRKFILSIGGQTYEFELSISEELAAHGGTNDELLDAKLFREGQVSFRRFMKYAGVVQDQDLVIRWNDRYITRRDGSPLMDCLVQWRQAALSKPVNARAIEEEEPLSSSDEREPETAQEIASLPKKTSSSWVRWWRSSRTTEPAPKPVASSPDLLTPQISSKEVNRNRPTLAPSSSAPPNSTAAGNSSIPFPTVSTPNKPRDSSSGSASLNGKRFAKTLRLTSDQLKQLDLNPGMNSITFSLSGSGATACTASIFLWEATDYVVVSDIDGTITKSDALGHVFTMIGRDWTHIGVAKLYTDICRNGYRIMYLTSRAIGQADSTRYYLKGINQNNYQLPEGPVIMSPDRLMASFHREVILRKPEVFKMACLRDIQRLFGSRNNPFYAGFGNRITDALSYRSVNIPSQRIFTIDSTGEVKMELLEVAGYKSSYIHLTDLVDQMFPPVHKKSVSEYSDFNYWKTPVQDFPLPDLSPPSPALSARSDTSGQTTFTRLRNFSLRSSSSVLPSPVTSSAQRGVRGMTSFERLTSLGTRSSETLVEDARAEARVRSRSDEDGSARDSRTRNRLSLVSMPGSMSGDQADFEFDEEDEDEMGSDYDGEDGEYEPPEDPEEAAEEGFDDDLLATGEMESVPFL